MTGYIKYAPRRMLIVKINTKRGINQKFVSQHVPNIDKVKGWTLLNHLLWRRSSSECIGLCLNCGQNWYQFYSFRSHVVNRMIWTFYYGGKRKKSIQQQSKPVSIANALICLQCRIDIWFRNTNYAVQCIKRSASLIAVFLSTFPSQLFWYFSSFCRCLDALHLYFYK